MAGSSPFLTKTLDAPSATGSVLPSSPLKQAWVDQEVDADARSPSPYETHENENYFPNDHHIDTHNNDEYDDQNQDELASSPFRYDARDDTVDFQKMREYTGQRQPFAGTSVRHQFPIEEEDEPPSSPFRADTRDENEEEPIDEPIDSYGLREVQPMSPGLDKRLAYEDPASSPFRADVRDETVDFDRLREMQGPASPGVDEQEEQDVSSPFRPEVQEEAGDFANMREVQRESLGKRQSVGKMAQAAPVEIGSSPFRPDAKDDTVSSNVSRGLKRESIGGQSTQSPGGPRSPFRHDREDIVGSRKSLLMQRESFGKRMSVGRAIPNAPVDAGGSPLRRASDAKDETVSSHVSRALQRESFGKSSQSPIGSRNSSFRHDEKDDTISSQKLRSAPRVSLGVDDHRSSTTARKRSFDQTPQDHEADSQNKERCKKGMTSRVEAPEIHIDLEEESSVIHNQSFVSAGSATYDRSTIANSMMEDKRNEGMSTVLHDDEETGKENQRLERADEHSILGEDDHDPMDDTGLSNFSVLPDMTSFANLRAQSPLKSMRGSVGPSPGPSADVYRRSLAPSTPGTAGRSYRASAIFDTGSQVGSPTPRRRGSRDVGNPRESSNLLDFTDQMNFFPRQSMQSSRYSPSRRSPMRVMRQSIRSPSKMSSLLDFDIPPAPTPRSLPSITPRELESLKSSFMSEISSLKATLSGKEAEVASLKQAVSDAERRVGEALEEARHEAARKDELEMEQAEWDRRGKEMETVLTSVRDELEDGERERDRLTRKVDEGEKAKEQLEGRIVELETQLSAARSSASASQSSSTAGSRQASQSAEATAREVQEAVEKVARELHTLYKSKHETKVAALKKSYEARWEKRLREVERKLAVATQDNDRLRNERDAAQSESMAAANASMIARENDEHEAEKRVFEAQVKGLQHEMAALKEDSERLRSELKSERAEKGELVAAVDEWLAMQQGQSAQAQPQEREREREPSVSSAGNYEEDYQYQSAGEPVESFNRSIGRSGSASSGIRPPPATNEKRIPRFGAAPGGHSRGNSGGKSGIAVFTPGRGGIMSSIERMGRGGV
jgi:hypothetical protein